MGVEVEEALVEIRMNDRRPVIHLEFYCEEDWLNSLEEGCQNRIVDQWVEWLASTYPEDEVPNIGCLIVVFPGNKKDYGKTYPSIKSWAQPVGALNDLLKKRYKLKGKFVFCP